jgi:putative transposase
LYRDNYLNLILHINKDAEKLPNAIREYHKFSAMFIKRFHPPTPSKIWFNYWDTCLTYEGAYFRRLNYIWFNPVKHGYVENPSDWKFGSYHYRFPENKDEMLDTENSLNCDCVCINDDF